VSFGQVAGFGTCPPQGGFERTTSRTGQVKSIEVGRWDGKTPHRAPERSTLVGKPVLASPRPTSFENSRRCRRGSSRRFARGPGARPCTGRQPVDAPPLLSRG
jgi:hypothetical protein